MTDTLPTVSTGPGWDPHRPATRIYVSGFEYKLVSARIPKPPLLNTVKVIFKWSLGSTGKANNIFYVSLSGTPPTNESGFLQLLANDIMALIGPTSTLPALLGPTTVLTSVECHDNGLDSGAVGVSTGAPIAGSAAAQSLPNNCAVCLSWGIPASYRGGKPRTYIPGIPTNAVNAGSSTLTTAFATNMQSAGAELLAGIDALSVSGHVPTMGTVSYQINHSPRPTPLFQPYLVCVVHERLDSQRRRSGKESAVGEIA